MGMMREQLFKIAEKSGMICIDSCCSVPNKSCSLDVWKGDLIAFANAVTADYAESLRKQRDDVLAMLESLVIAAENIGGEHVTGLDQLNKKVDEANAAIAKAKEQEQ